MVDHNIVGFDVTVHNPHTVAVVQSLRVFKINKKKLSNAYKSPKQASKAQTCEFTFSSSYM